MLEAAANGALDGLRLAIQVAGIIIAFLSLLAMLKFGVDRLLALFGQGWTLEDLLGYLFAPFAWTMGIEPADCRKAGELLGLRMISNEFIGAVAPSRQSDLARLGLRAMLGGTLACFMTAGVLV